MSESKLELIEKAIDGIDEKYIDSAVKRIYKNMGTAAELTEIKVEVPSSRRYSRAAGFFRTAITAVAAVALIFGAGLLISQLPALSEQPSETSASQLTSAPLSGTEQPGKDPVPAGSDEAIYLPLLEYPYSFDFELFEGTFYGMWQEENGVDQINLTYYGYNSYEPWRYHAGNITRTKEGVIMEGISGGTGTYLYIKNSEPDKMYLYEDVTAPTLYTSEYNGVYERVTGENAAEFDGELKNGSLTLAGRKKLKALTGCDSEYDMVTVQPNYYWYPSYNAERGCGEFYLRERTANKIVWSAQYVSDEIYNEMDGDINVYGWCVYITLTAELTNGEWKLTDAQWYDKEIENTGFGNPWYHDTSDGHYYAVDRGKDYDRSNKCYYFNGMEYADVSWGSACPSSASFDVRGDTLFYLAQSDNGDYYFVAAKEDKEIIHSDVILEYDQKYDKELKIVSAIEVGDYIVTEIRIVTDNGPLVIARVFDNNPIKSGFLPLINVELDEDDEGFTAEPDPAYYYRISGAPRTVGKFHYRGDGDNSLSDTLWSLENKAGVLRRFFAMGIGNIADIDDILYRKTDEGEFIPWYYYKCGRRDYNNYLYSVYDRDSTIVSLMDDGDIAIQSGKVYGQSKVGGGNGNIGDIVCEIESETEDSAVILYTAYTWDYDADTVSDEVYDTYRVTAKKTENGWRFDSAIYEF